MSNNGVGELSISSGVRTCSNRVADFDILSDRIANALEGSIPNVTSESLAALVSEVKATLTQLQEECKRTSAIALDPLTRSSEGVGARADVFDLEFKIERLEKALGKLYEKHELALSHEKEAALAAKIAELKQEQAALAAELSEAYPRLAGELSGLLGRVSAFDQKAQPYGVTRIESVARGIPPHGLVRGTTMVGWLTDSVRLPAFSPDDSIMQKDLWPRPRAHIPNANIGAMLGGLTPQMMAHSAALGNEGRRIGEEVQRNRMRERRANAPSPLHAPFVPVLDIGAENESGKTA